MNEGVDVGEHQAAAEHVEKVEDRRSGPVRNVFDYPEYDHVPRKIEELPRESSRNFRAPEIGSSGWLNDLTQIGLEVHDHLPLDGLS